MAITVMTITVMTITIGHNNSSCSYAGTSE